MTTVVKAQLLFWVEVEENMHLSFFAEFCSQVKPYGVGFYVVSFKICVLSGNGRG